MNTQPDDHPQTSDIIPASTESAALAPSLPEGGVIDPHPQPLPTRGRGADGAHVPPAEPAAAMDSAEASGSAESESAALAPAEETAANETPEWEPRVLTLPLSPAQAAAAREAERRLRLEPWLTEVFAKMATTQPLSDRELHALRVLSDLLALWALCEAPACRREGTCRGSEPHCFGDVGDLVPVCALPFLAGFVAGQLDRLPFDAMLARLPQGTLQHWLAWHAAVAQITGRASRHSAAGGAW